MGRDRGQLVTVGRDDDGQSSVLGVVLMMGFVAAAAVSVFVIGTATVGETKDTAQERQVENTFKQFNKDISSVAYGRQKYRAMQFDIKDQTAAFRQQNTGTIEVWVDGSMEESRSVGSLVYENNGETIAYQAGGVWRGTGRDSRMVSRPPVEYQNGSLTFPIMVLDGDDQVRAGKLDLNKKETDSLDSLGYVQGKLVTLYITSEYYMGWAEYFRTQTNDVSVSVDHSPAGDKGTVKVKLGKPIANGDFEDGVLATGGDDGDVQMGGGSPEIDGPVAATGDINDPDDEITGEKSPNLDKDLYELDTAIVQKVTDASNDASSGLIDYANPENGGATLNNGETYYDPDGFNLADNGDDLIVDLSSGNVTLVVDGDIELTDGEIQVKNGGDTEYAFRIYTTGDFGMKNTFAGDLRDQSGSNSAAKHFQVYGKSDMLVGLQGGSTRFVGTIYAPRNEPELGTNDANTAMPDEKPACEGWDACVYKGSSAVKGAIVAGPTKFANGASMTYDTDLGDIQPTMQLDDGVLPPPITFLKVSVHTVAVNNSGASSIQPVGGFGASASVTAPPMPSTPSTTGFASVAGPASPFAAPTARSTGRQ